MIEDLKANPKEHQKFHELPKQCAEKEEQEDQKRRKERSETWDKENMRLFLREAFKKYLQKTYGTFHM